MIRLVRMRRDKTECWMILPKLIDAMLASGFRTEQRNTERVCRRYEADFVLDGQRQADGSLYQPTWAAWVAWDDLAQTVRAHVVGCLDFFCDTPVVYVSQLEIGRGVSQELQDRATEEFLQWTREVGCTEILMMTRLDYPRLWRRRGFTRFRAVYRREV